MTKVHVVVIEDDKDISFLLMNYLDREEWIEAVHISEAHAAMDKHQWTYGSNDEVVGIIDLMLPGCSGVDVARWVRENIRHHCPLIAITAASQHSDIYKEARDSDCFDLLLFKPIDSKLLIHEIARLSKVFDR